MTNINKRTDDMNKYVPKKLAYLKINEKEELEA